MCGVIVIATASSQLIGITNEHPNYVEYIETNF